jgi:cysteinyl-tRNA synthetase
MKIHNTLTGQKEVFEPLIPGRASMYACGVTVYDYCHVGHARSAIIFDVIRRYMRCKGFQVTYVRNFTDIDDKIINKARQENVAWDVIAKQYTDAYYEDMDMLGVGRADVEPKATEYINEMIEIIEALIGKGIAYVSDGSVYFSVDKFPGYGKLSKRDMEEMLAGARVDVDKRKKNPLDFVLWKNSKEGEPFWKSPWGLGRPGWHIECSAMSLKHLGKSFDIHGGGADLLFPHHENEIAQSEAFTGTPFAKYWVHNGFITIDKEKMSKSLGNFFTIREVLDNFDPEVLRFFLLATHYRSPIEFSDEQLREAESSIDRYYTTAVRTNDFLERNDSGHKELSGTGKSFSELLSAFKERFEEAMDDDFNTAQALGHIFELIRECNRFLDSKPSGQKAVELILKTRELLSETGTVLNIFSRTPLEWYSSLMHVKKIGLSEEDILEQIGKRKDARNRKDWQTADIIRRDLEEKGVLLEDKKDRTDWKIKVG